MRQPCPDFAQVVYEDRHGARHGYCELHRSNGRLEAARHDWLVMERREAA